MTDPSPRATTTIGAAPPRERSAAGRRVVTVVFTGLTGLLIAHGAAVVHRDTLTVPTGGTADNDCSTGIHRLYAGFTTVWSARQDGHEAPVPPLLERDLLALRPACERDGAQGAAAYEALLRWRYRAEGQTHVWSALLTSDAERALGYHSPPAAALAPSPGSSR